MILSLTLIGLNCYSEIVGNGFSISTSPWLSCIVAH
jgi:hypothetical protein